VIFDAEDGSIIRIASNSKMCLLVKRRKIPTNQSATEATIYKMKAPYERKTVLRDYPKSILPAESLQDSRIRK
jgi:hypothetical protein